MSLNPPKYYPNANVPTFTLANGVEMPALGYGCNTLGRSVDNWMMEPDGDYRPLYYALDAGYRYFDTAIDYHNESALGLLLSETTIPRHELFLSTKLPERPKYIAAEEGIREYVARSLARFHTDYLDLLLIHRPSEDVKGLLRAWRVFEELYRKGKVRAIGVSNFEIPLLNIFLKETDVKPMVNQIMMNPGVWHRELADFCLMNNIRPTAWSPLRNLTDENRTLLAKVGAEYGKTWAQVLLRYDFQSGIVTVPKSHMKNEIKENIQIFDFCLTDAEMNRISSIRGLNVEFKL
ncbi:MAG: aldo/keto reductase [Clostridiales bacterium]|nr:aldo/keto reductase [Clostridiales bacterium]